MARKRKYTKTSEIGKIFGRLVIIDFKEAYSENGKRYSAKAICQCSCNSELHEVFHYDLIRHNVNSCGCLKEELVRIKFTKYRKETEIGKVFGRLTVVDFKNGHYKKNEEVVLTTAICQCSCGSPICEITYNSLLRGATKSCGCLKKEISKEKNTKYRRETEIGKIFGRLTIINFKEAYSKNNKSYNPIAICQCNCGSPICEINYYSLLNDDTRSCGCFQKENMKVLKLSKTHGLSNTDLYKTYTHILSRCNNKNNSRYNSYGGRGIKCLFASPEDFINYINTTLGPKPTEQHSLDRINNDGNYEKGNLRWATPKEQVANQRVKIFKSEYDKLNRAYEILSKTLEAMLIDNLIIG